MRDNRLPPFLWIANDAMLRLGGLDPRERIGAIGVYTCLSYMASRHRDSDHQGFSVPRREIAEIAGCTVKTVDRYVGILVEAGLLTIEKQYEKGGSRPNLWVLADTDPGGREENDPRVAERHEVGRSNDPRGGSSNDTPIEEVVRTEERSVYDDAPARELAAEIIRYFAVKSGGLEWTGAKMVEMIEERIAEHPELSIEDHRRIMDAAFEQPWWSEQNPSPFVVYGKPTIFGTRIAKAAPREHPVDRRIRELEERKQQLRAEGR